MIDSEVLRKCMRPAEVEVLPDSHSWKVDVILESKNDGRKKKEEGK